MVLAEIHGVTMGTTTHSHSSEPSKLSALARPHPAYHQLL